MKNGECFMTKGRSMRSESIRRLGVAVLFGAGCVLGLGWYPLDRHISPPAITLCEAENAACVWLIAEENKHKLALSSPADFFVRMIFYEKPETVNNWMRVLARPNVSTNNGTEAKWYFEFARSKAQGISHMCSVGTNKMVVLEWSRY